MPTREHRPWPLVRCDNLRRPVISQLTMYTVMVVVVGLIHCATRRTDRAVECRDVGLNSLEVAVRGESISRLLCRGMKAGRRPSLVALFWLFSAGSLEAQATGDLRPAWSPDGRSVLIQTTRDGNDEIYSIEVSTGHAKRLTEDLSRDAQPSWSPDGSHIVFVSDRDRDSYSGRAAYQLYVMRADGSDVRRLAATESADFMPRWSPDGERVAFLSDRDGIVRLYVMPSAGGEARPVLPDSFRSTPGNPTWSPDGTRLGFDALEGSAYDIFSVNLETSIVENITQSPESEWYPVWAPGGDFLLTGVVTGTREDGTHQIVSIDLESGRRSGLTGPTPRDERARDWWPSWAPDGTRVVFVSRRAGPWRLFVIDSDGTNERPLGRR